MLFERVAQAVVMEEGNVGQALALMQLALKEGLPLTPSTQRFML